MKAGQDLVVGGFIGLGGTVYATEHKKGWLRRTLPEDLLETAAGFCKYLEVDLETVAKKLCGGTAMRIVREGGILTALWNMAEEYHAGLTVYLRRIPIRQETVEVCEALGLNPYGLQSGGCVLLAADNGNDILREFEKAGIGGAVIGKVTDSNDRIILNGDTCSYLNRPEPDEIKKLEDTER